MTVQGATPEDIKPGERPGLMRSAMFILWPSFVVAGMLEALVFALVDPGELAWLGGAELGLSRSAVYTLAFLLFWLLVSLASSLTMLLATLPPEPERPHPRAWPR